MLLEVGALEIRDGFRLPILVMEYDYQPEDAITDYPILSELEWRFKYYSEPDKYTETNQRLESFLDILQSTDKEVTSVTRTTDELNEVVTLGWVVTLR